MIEEGLNVENEKHLEWAMNQLAVMELTLASLRDELGEKNPRLLAAASPAYERRIASLQKEIAAYLYRHPPAVSAVMKSNNFAVARNLSPEQQELAVASTKFGSGIHEVRSLARD
ncbi:MAG: hypothetical protein H7145_12985 [Akkermansiaceae bacterium]|nr:hypothetical protein [Armatimonadota bacterium]